MNRKENKMSSQDEMFIEIWNLLFARRFGFRVNFSKINLPSVKDNHVFSIVMPRQLARGKVGIANRIVGVCKESFLCYSYYDDLDAAIVHNERTPKNGSYAIRVGSHIEATDGDSELKNLSANGIWERGLLTLTLPERLMQELYIWHTLGRHLDARDATLCAGSRYSDGCVPCVYWCGGVLGVYYYSPDDRYDRLRARAAVP